MGFRFQRRIKILPGLRLNLSKSGIGISAASALAWTAAERVTQAPASQERARFINLAKCKRKISGDSLNFTDTAASWLPGSPRLEGYQIVADRAAKLAPGWPLISHPPSLKRADSYPRIAA
jgi:hypothetical protein